MQTSDPVVAFLDAMESAGMKPVEPIASKLGKELVRFQCDGDRNGRRNGWAVLHLDATPAGAFGHYAFGISETWRANSGRCLSRGERAALSREYEEARRQRDAEILVAQETAAAECMRRWDTAGPVDPQHAYLVRKRISGEGLRQSADRLVVPMRDDAGKLWNVQRIGPDGSKRFAKGGKQKGLHLVLGKPADTVLIAEGFSTAASVRRATGHAAVVAFSKDNLKATALSIRDRWPDAEIIICADDDAHLEVHPRILKNLGVEAANDAARAVGGRVAMPPRSQSYD
jgi:putative DNA primase/helicase